jgi:outer membrane murein-binding lipoprotein Lpp
MAIIKRASSQALVLAGLLLAGCAMEGSDGLFTTGSLTGSATASAEKADPACVTLASRIESLRKDGIPDKIEKAAAKRYKMTQADLGKADQLTKANAEFQARCSTVMPRPTTAAAPAEPVASAAPKKAAKANTTKTP